jgi:hypothetical protein
MSRHIKWLVKWLVKWLEWHIKWQWNQKRIRVL